MVMCGNEFKTKENKIWTTDNIKPQHMYFGKRSTMVYIYLFIFNDITTRVYYGKLQFANLRSKCFRVCLFFPFGSTFAQ